MATRKSYTPEFKREAVRLADERGNRSAVARELGIRTSMIRRWKEQLKENGKRAFPGKGNPRDEEMAKLHRELKRAKEENAILKRPSVSSQRALGEIPVHGRASRAVLHHGHGSRLGSVNQWVLQLASPRRKPAKQSKSEVTRRDKSHTRRKRCDLRQSPDPSGAAGARHPVWRKPCGTPDAAVRGARKTSAALKATTDSGHDLPVAENHLDRRLDPERPNEAWAADITFVWTREGWLYLAVVMDLFSRRIIGWSMQSRLKRELVIDALKMATGSRHLGNSLLCHSDRGSQYASGDYQALLAGASIACST